MKRIFHYRQNGGAFKAEKGFFCSIDTEYGEKTFYGNTEPEAIFKACNYILHTMKEHNL